MTAQTLTPGRHPFEVAAFSALLMAGVVGLFGGQSNAIIEAYPRPFVLVYYGIVAFWSAVGLAGLCVRDQQDRLRNERIACYGVGYCALAYVIAALFVSGWGAATAAAGVGWISLACTWRIRQIHIDLRRLRTLGVAISVEEEPEATP